MHFLTTSSCTNLNLKNNYKKFVLLAIFTLLVFQVLLSYNSLQNTPSENYLHAKYNSNEFKHKSSRKSIFDLSNPLNSTNVKLCNCENAGGLQNKFETENVINNDLIKSDLFNKVRRKPTTEVPAPLISNEASDGRRRIRKVGRATSPRPTSRSSASRNRWRKRNPEKAKDLDILNQFGMNGQNTPELLKIVMNSTENDRDGNPIGQAILKKYMEIQQRKASRDNSPRKRRKSRFKKTKITLASVFCGKMYYEELENMLKSAFIFSQDASLHLVTFADDDSFIFVISILLELKWKADALNQPFTFELQMEWYPRNVSPLTHKRVNWKGMYKTCATQRLFFPELLPHMDSVIYLDWDVLVVSNLTEMWLTFPNKMADGILAAAAANNEKTSPGYYEKAHVPHFGTRGLNAGVMLMNLTLMREFQFASKSIAAHSLYREWIALADQDIINILASIFPDVFMQLECSYNFNWVHCGDNGFPCYNQTSGANYCFCHDAEESGVKIVHGNGGTFHSKYVQHSFLQPLHDAFEQLDVLDDHEKHIKMIQELKRNFAEDLNMPCFPLTPDMLYGNAEKYLHNLNALYH